MDCTAHSIDSHSFTQGAAAPCVNPIVKQKTASGVKKLTHPLCRGFAANEPRYHQGCSAVEQKVASGGRLLQADPFVQSPTFALSYNRYSYVWNNPINMIDPSGYVAMTSPYSYDYDAETPTDGCAACGGNSPVDDNVGGLDRLLGGIRDAWNSFNRWADQVNRDYIDGRTPEQLDWLLRNGLFHGRALSYAQLKYIATSPNTAEQVKIYARMAAAAYGWVEGTIGSYSLTNVYDEISGLRAVEFFSTALNKTVLAFAGTHFTKINDWITNFKQGLGITSDQYQEAFNLASSYGSDTHFVGHSLGGGLASYAALTVDGSATVFNAAGLHSSTIGNFDAANASVTHFYSSRDIVQSINSTFGYTVPGAQYNLGNAGWHLMGDMCSAVGTSC